MVAIYERDAFILLIGLVTFLITLLLFMMVSSVIQEVVTENNVIEYEVVETTDLYALNDITGLEARGYLFSTYVESELQYNYVVETPLGYDVKNVDADKCFIKHADSQPNIQELEVVPSNKVAKFFSVP